MHLISKIYNLCGPDPRTSQTDGRTHTRTTCDCKTALCSSVRGALKQRQNTGITVIDIADNVNLKTRYTVLSINNFRPMNGWNGRIGSQRFDRLWTHSVNPVKPQAAPGSSVEAWRRIRSRQFTVSNRYKPIHYTRGREKLKFAFSSIRILQCVEQPLDTPTLRFLQNF